MKKIISLTAILSLSLSGFTIATTINSERSCPAPLIQMFFEGVEVSFVRPNQNYVVRVTASEPGYVCLAGGIGWVLLGGGNGCDDVPGSSGLYMERNIRTNADLNCSGIVINAFSMCYSSGQPVQSYFSTYIKYQKCGIVN